MPFTDSLAVNVGDPTRASDYNKVADNAAFLLAAFRQQHDATSLASADGKHLAHATSPMRLQMLTGQEYSLAGFRDSGNFRVVFGEGALSNITPTVGYYRDLVVGRADAGVLHIGEGFSGVTVAGSQFGDGTVTDGWKVRLSQTVTWTFKPLAITGPPAREVVLVKFADVAFNTLNAISDADRIWDLSQTSAPF